MRSRIVVALKGACMGFADAIPGVSGGTMALILGIYQRFIAALGAIGPALVPLLLKPAFWRELVIALKPGETVATDEPTKVMAQHMAFLLNVGIGILTGVLIGVRILPTMMDTWPEAMRAFFFGLVLASIIVPWSKIHRKTSFSVVIFVVACLGTYALMGLRPPVSGFAETQVRLSTADGQPLSADRTIPAAGIAFATDTGQEKLKREKSFHPAGELTLKQGESSWMVEVVAAQGGDLGNVPAGSLVQVVNSDKHQLMEGFVVQQPTAATGGSNPALWYVFVCGAIAISAMLLPGISGSFLLLMLGLYGYILHSARALIYSMDMSLVPVVAVFLAGIAVGVLAFSRFLKWLLASYHDGTMAFLAGLMLGSLRALWPFQAGVGHDTNNVLPAAFDGTAALAVGALVGGVIIVLTLHIMGNRLADRRQPAGG